MAKLGSLGNELFRYRKRSKRSLDGSAPGAPYARFRRSLRPVSGMPYVPRQGSPHHDIYNWGQPRQYHPNIHAPAAQSDEYHTDPDWESHIVPHSHQPHLFRPFPEIERSEPQFDYGQARRESGFFLKAMEVQYQPFEEGQEVPSLAEMWEQHLASDEQDMPDVGIPEPEMPNEVAELTAEEIAGRLDDIAGALSHLWTVFPKDHPDIVALTGALHEILDDPEATSKLESLAVQTGPSNHRTGDPYENDPVEEAAYTVEQIMSMPQDAYDQPFLGQLEFQGFDDGLGAEPVMASDPFQGEAQFMEDSGLEQIVEQEDMLGPAPAEMMNYDVMPDDLAMEMALPSPMDELHGYDSMMAVDEINQAVDHAMDLPAMQKPVPDPWHMQHDPFAQAQNIFDQQMQFMANPLMMPGMGPMGPAPGPAPM